MWRRWLSRRLTTLWYGKRSIAAYLLCPFSYIFRAVVFLRRHIYRCLSKRTVPIPIVVVGNISVGGCGKTPFVIFLARLLQSQGYRVGIVTRGYRSRIKRGLCEVLQTANARDVGDEPLLLARRSGAHVVVAPKRVLAAYYLWTQKKCDVIISDDGLQHYALARDIEIVLMNGQCGVGNGYCLPAGPLREPMNRLREVDFIINNTVHAEHEHVAEEYSMHYVPQDLVNMLDNKQRLPLRDVRGKTLHAVAAIAHPERFFQSLEALGALVIPHAFADHETLRQEDLAFSDEHMVVMTEKDAMKYQGQAHMWYLPIAACLDDKFERVFLDQLTEIKKNRGH